MATKQRSKPVIAERSLPQDVVLIQLQEKRRNAKGRLTFRKSKSLTVYNLTLEEVEARLRTALEK